MKKRSRNQIGSRPKNWAGPPRPGNYAILAAQFFIVLCHGLTFPSTDWHNAPRNDGPGALFFARKRCEKQSTKFHFTATTSPAAGHLHQFSWSEGKERIRVAGGGPDRCILQQISSISVLSGWLWPTGGNTANHKPRCSRTKSASGLVSFSPKYATTRFSFTRLAPLAMIRIGAPLCFA